MTVGLAEIVDRSGGSYEALHFSRDQMKEIRYAALLHDFGKVGVREEVLVKAKNFIQRNSMSFRVVLTTCIKRWKLVASAKKSMRCSTFLVKRALRKIETLDDEFRPPLQGTGRRVCRHHRI